MIAKSEAVFACTRCGRCCLEPGYVFFTHAERKKAAKELGISALEFCRRHGGGESGTEIRVTRRRKCPFLGENGCVIYTARPTQCRTFPYWREITCSPRSWNETARRCPGMVPIDPRRR
jgi:hypothetical protein